MAKELDTAADHWQWALDAEARALDAASDSLRPATIGAERQALVRERREVSALLASAAATRGIRPAPWLAPYAVTPHMLGLPRGTKACVFDLDGVLTDSGVLHAAAWAQAFDPILMAYAHATDSAFVPFDRHEDYRAYFDGRPRLEGIHLFLAGRGLHLDAYEIAKRKGEALERALEHRALVALAGAHAYLQAAGHARLGRAVVSASTTTLPMLRAAGIAHLVEVRVDAETMRRDGLRARPEPDLLLAACRELDVDPAEAVSLTHNPAGVVAAQRAGVAVVEEPLASLLDPALRAAAGVSTFPRTHQNFR